MQLFSADAKYNIQKKKNFDDENSKITHNQP